MKDFIKRWLITTKHKIVADSETGFQELFVHTLAELENLDMVVIRIKMRKKKFNGDYDGYTRNYRATIWAIKKDAK